MQRRRIARYGLRGATVAVFSERTPAGRYCRVQWREGGRRRTRSFPDSAAGRLEAKAFAAQIAAEQRPAGQAPAITLHALWTTYVAAEFDALRPKTQTNYRHQWWKWEQFVDPTTPARAVTREDLDRFRKALRAQQLAVKQIRNCVDLVKLVYRFGVDRDLVPPTRILEYRVKAGKDEKRLETAEYRPQEGLRILGALDPSRAEQWRAWALFTILHYMGPRVAAALRLQWSDIDVARAMITWPVATDKMGKRREQPVPAQVAHALQVAWAWRTADGYAGPWVFYTPRRRWKGDRPLTYGGVQRMLREAERRAGVAHVHMNATHRFRRGAAGTVYELTGDAGRAMEWIGDDIRQAGRYVKARGQRLRAVADLLSGADDGKR